MLQTHEAIKQLPFITINSISQLTCSIAVTQGNSRYLGGFGITKPTDVINVELDVEKRMQAEVLKRQVRIKEFFHDFDRLRKGTVGEAGVSAPLISLSFVCIVQNMPWYFEYPSN